LSETQTGNSAAIIKADAILVRHIFPPPFASLVAGRPKSAARPKPAADREARSIAPNADAPADRACSFLAVTNNIGEQPANFL